MSKGPLRFIPLVCAAVLAAQTPGQAPPVPTLPANAVPPPPAGLEPDWEIGAILQKIAAHAANLSPALERIDARSWIDQGASETYAEQLQSAKDQARALNSGTLALVKNPEKLPDLLDLFFRMQAIDSMLGSVEEGIRKYGNRPDAQTLTSLQAESSPDRDRLQRYIVNLAAARDREFQAMDHEAQRCRGVVTAPRIVTVKKK
jgi:hypothetical protein